MTEIAERLAQVRARIDQACDSAGRPPGTVELLAVSKTRPLEQVRAALDTGQTAFGENRVQELVTKSTELATSAARWHLIGSLQTNKCRSLVRIPGLVLVHSLDRPSLAEKLQLVFAEADVRLDVLLQVDATNDSTKHGVEPGDAPDLARQVVRDCPALRLRGLMAMGPRRGDPAPVFRQVAGLGEELRDSLGISLPVLSFGMTADLEVAIAAGSTLVRVGTGLFGPRT